MRVGVSAGFDWTNYHNGMRDNNYLIFKEIQSQHPDLEVVAIDWRSIDKDGKAKGYDFSKKIIDDNIAVGELDLYHNIYLGPVFGEWDELVEKLKILENKGVSVINPVETIQEGIKKYYLLGLQEKGVPVVPSELITPKTLERWIKDNTLPRNYIVKPIDGEKGQLVNKTQDITDVILQNYKSNKSDLLLQPFFEEVMTAGECSLIYFNNKFSHGAMKYPTNGFKVNNLDGRRLEGYCPTLEEIELGYKAIVAFPKPVYTARIDFIKTKQGPLVSEIEVVNPAHFSKNLENHKDLGGKLGRFYKEIGDKQQ